MTISVTYGNVLLVDGEFLRNVSPDYVRQVLKAGRETIIKALDVQYEEVAKRAPNVQRGSVWVMHLAKDIGSVIMPELMAVHEFKQSNRDVYSNVNTELVQPAFRQYWHAVRAAGFLPEVRLADANIKKMKGVCLLVRDTPLLD